MINTGEIHSHALVYMPTPLNEVIFLFLLITSSVLIWRSRELTVGFSVKWTEMLCFYPHIITVFALAVTSGAVCPPGESTHWTLEVVVEFSADCVGSPGHVVVRPGSLVRRAWDPPAGWSATPDYCYLWSCMSMEPLWLYGQSRRDRGACRIKWVTPWKLFCCRVIHKRQTSNLDIRY